MPALPTELTPATLPALLRLLRGAGSSRRPERDLVRLLAQLTGGFAEVRASWGDVVAAAGEGAGTAHSWPLTHGGRNVGTLRLALPPQWDELAPIAAEYALLARLQSAAAGAARRRVGERQFEALLAGDSSGQPESGPCALAALRLDQPLPRAERARAAYIHRLDILCSAGEGYFHGRGLECLTTVRGDKALWLWPSSQLEQEALGLHQALLNAAQGGLRLGVSGQGRDFAQAPSALRQAVQALDATRPGQLKLFEAIDPLQNVLRSAALRTLSEQLRALLRAHDEDGKLEDTLRHYLNHRGSLGDLAALLNVHVNTLRYRLRRCEEILGGELSEPAFVTRLYLAFHAQGDVES